MQPILSPERTEEVSPAAAATPTPAAPPPFVSLHYLYTQVHEMRDLHEGLMLVRDRSTGILRQCLRDDLRPDVVATALKEGRLYACTAQMIRPLEEVDAAWSQPKPQD